MTIPTLDKYAVNARLIPALIVLLPLGLSLICLFPDKFAGWDLIVWLGASGGLAVFLEQLARDKGKGKEPSLYEKWGGKPTTIMLRHTRSPLGAMTVSRYHNILGSSIPGIKMPTKDDEEKDLKYADEVYESCAAFLRAKTRDREKFRMIFEENVNYGFRRNLWGMKPLAILLIMVSIILVLTQIHPNWLNPEKVKPVALVALLLDASFLLIWWRIITTDWVRTAANVYARQLLASCDQL